MARIPDIHNNTDDQISFLVDQKCGKLNAAALYGLPVRMTGQQIRDRDAAKVQQQKRAAYSEELNALSPAELKQRFESELERCRAKSDAEESKRWFNQSSSAADVKHWAMCSYWTVDEGVALLLGRDPRSVTWEAIESHTRISALAKKFSDLRDVATRAHAAAVLGGRNVPGMFIRWADRSGIDVPSALREAVLARGIVIADWQDAYDKQKAVAEQLAAKLQTERSVCARLIAERDLLLHKLDERPAGTWPWGNRETALMKHLAAAADKFWKLYDPADKTTAPHSRKVQKWLEERDVAKRVAQVMAQILRDDGIPTGPRR